MYNEANQYKGISYLSKYLAKHSICSKKENLLLISEHLLYKNKEYSISSFYIRFYLNEEK